jgi:chemotaxis response regulator CheB
MQKLKNINLVIASGSEKIQRSMNEMFSQHGAVVTLCGFLNLEFVARLEDNVTADVILIDMNDAYEEDDAALDRLLEKIDLPILFHDNDFDELNAASVEGEISVSVVDKLAIKLAELVGSKAAPKESVDNELSEELSPDEALEIVQQKLSGDIALLESNKAANESEVLITKDSDLVTIAEQDDYDNNAIQDASLSVVTSIIKHKKLENKQAAETSDLLNIWVLGASIGGPEAVKRFLARVPRELPVAFVLAQHLGDGFVSLLANQLDRISSFYVKEAVEGDTLSHGEVIVVPVDNRMSVNEKGQIVFFDKPWKGHYKPSIDSVINSVTKTFEKKSGVIIFSGMGADGVLASQQFAEKYQGNIWAQSSDTCVISSMPDSVRKANLVSYSGSPEALALKIAVKYMGKNSYIV